MAYHAAILFSFYLASQRLPAIGTRLYGEVAGGFASSDRLTRLLAVFRLDRQAICQTTGA
jgi:hypothetical protein